MLNMEKMKGLQKSKRMSKRQLRAMEEAEAWRRAQSDALAAYQRDYKPGDPALSQIEINEIYGQPLLNPALSQK
jgi:hypothetical protein